ncbi:MAG: DUF192 domain-containing protein [Elainella sp.]
MTMLIRRRAVLLFGLGLLLLGCSTSAGSPAGSPAGTSSLAPNQTAEPLAQSSPSPTVQPPVVREDLAQVLPISAEAKIADQTIQLEVARTPEEQSRGLMYRPALPDDRGMLFPFEAARPLRFWMLNTPQPLDMVFLLNDEVKAVIADVPPCASRPCPTYGPGVDVNQVIELRSGRAAELGIKAGDRIEIRFFEPK